MDCQRDVVFYSVHSQLCAKEYFDNRSNVASNLCELSNFKRHFLEQSKEESAYLISSTNGYHFRASARNFILSIHS